MSKLVRSGSDIPSEVQPSMSSRHCRTNSDDEDTGNA
nr:hypothetical protein BDDEJBFL_00028 [Agrobacterium fabrum]